MSGLFNFLKNLISGIFSFLGGLVGLSPKKAGYYMEWEGAKEAKPTASSEPVVAPAAKATTVAPSKPAATPKAEPAKPEPVAIIAQALNLPKPSVEPFAPKYLISTSTPRRRPGANMSSFLDMARQINPSN